MSKNLKHKNGEIDINPEPLDEARAKPSYSWLWRRPARMSVQIGLCPGQGPTCASSHGYKQPLDRRVYGGLQTPTVLSPCALHSLCVEERRTLHEGRRGLTCCTYQSIGFSTLLAAKKLIQMFYACLGLLLSPSSFPLSLSNSP